MASSKKLINRVEQYRTELGWSQSQLAVRCNPQLSAKTIARAENPSKRFAATTYHRILNALNAERKSRNLTLLEMKDVFPNGIQ